MSGWRMVQYRMDGEALTRYLTIEAETAGEAMQQAEEELEGAGIKARLTCILNMPPPVAVFACAGHGESRHGLLHGGSILDGRALDVLERPGNAEPCPACGGPMTLRKMPVKERADGN